MVSKKSKKIAALLSAGVLSGAVLLASTSHAEAARRCPRGQEDVNDVCVAAPGEGGANSGGGTTTTAGGGTTGTTVDDNNNAPGQNRGPDAHGRHRRRGADDTTTTSAPAA